MALNEIVKKFLEKRQTKPVLLALSGGPDSLALYHILQSLNIKFGVAHVDHKWRTESTTQALQLQQMVKEPFHLKTLGKLSGNLEAASREARIAFFVELCRTHDYQAVILAHHADDLAETVLKRVLEGSHLAYLGGMREVNTIDGIEFWRPLLKVQKKELVQYTHHLHPFDDYTNLDPRFLRGRMRTQMLPLLQEQFGKNVNESLCRLAEESYLLRDYFDQKIKEFPVVEGALGLSIDLRNVTHRVEKLYLLRHFLGHSAKQVLDLLHLGNKRIIVDQQIIFIDRGRIFIPKKIEPLTTQSLKEGKYGQWMVTIKEVQGQTQVSSWEEAWKGKIKATIPLGEYTLGPGNNSLSKWWTNHKVPAFLRYQIPVLWQAQKIEYEFLTGKIKGLKTNQLECLEINLEWIS